MATHSSVLAWRIPGTGEPGGLPSIGSHKVGHNWSDLAAAAAAERTYRTAHTSHEVLAWSRGALLHTSVRAPPQGPGCCGVGATLEWHRGHVITILWWRCGCCYGCCVSQQRGCVTAAVSARREHVSAVPEPPRVSFQPLSLGLADPGFSEQCAQCEQRDNWHHKQDEEQYKNTGTYFFIF